LTFRRVWRVRGRARKLLEELGKWGLQVGDSVKKI